MLDPIADKLLVASVLLVLVGVDRLTGASILPAAIILCREILVSGLREFLAQLQVGVPVTRLSKWKTTLQMVAIGFLVVGDAGPVRRAVSSIDIGLYGLWVAAALTLVTGYDYLRAGLHHVAADRRPVERPFVATRRSIRRRATSAETASEEHRCDCSTSRGCGRRRGLADEEVTPPAERPDVAGLIAWLAARGGGPAEALADLRPGARRRQPGARRPRPSGRRQRRGRVLSAGDRRMIRDPGSTDFDVAAELAGTAGRQASRLCVFVGTVRELSGGRTVAAMTLEHYPGMTERAARSARGRGARAAGR